ncbi:MAG TPA: multicopper oxidase domain-containing protein [Vicinamibacterales bacterium]|nr:multicopper oxidase domain-containing protein [Vicinamibacterales bacterium]
MSNTTLFNRREIIRLLGLSTIAGTVGCDQPSAGVAAAHWPQAASGNGFVPDVELLLTAAPDEVAVLPGERTGVWRFSGRVLKGPAGALQSLPGSYLGPVLRLRRGQKVRVRFANQLPEPSIIHWHGLDVPERADGHPRLAIGAGSEYVYEFEVTNRAGTYWYHPHPHMRTGPQVYYGMAGLLLVHDEEEERLALPAGESELLCVLQDRQFDARNQLVYQGGNMMEAMNGVLGDRVLVSGRPQPTTEVDAAWHRVRLLNGSNARIYKLAWSRDLPMIVIGGDGGLLEAPLRRTALTLAPGQRADVLLDLTGLSAGTEVHLDSEPFAEADASVVGMMGMGGRGMGSGSAVPNGAPLRAMTLRARARRGPSYRVPDRLSTFDADWTLRTDLQVRRVPLTMQRMAWLLGGRTFEMGEVAADETIAAGETRVWEFENRANPMGMEAAHPIHIHGRQFRVIERRGGRATNTLRAGIVDEGWRDVVLVLPGETVRVQVPFTRHPGLYLYHCHILEHEDMGMMRNFRVT